MSKLKIITTRTKDGNFDKNKESFPNLTEEESRRRLSNIKKRKKENWN